MHRPISIDTSPKEKLLICRVSYREDELRAGLEEEVLSLE